MSEHGLMLGLILAEWRGAVLLAAYLAVALALCVALPCGSSGDNA